MHYRFLYFTASRVGGVPAACREDAVCLSLPFLQCRFNAAPWPAVQMLWGMRNVLLKYTEEQEPYPSDLDSDIPS